MEQIKKFLHGKGFALLLTASLLAAAAAMAALGLPVLRFLARLRRGCGRCAPCGQNCKKVWMG